MIGGSKPGGTTPTRGRGRTTPRFKKPGRQTRHWLSGVKLRWEPAFLPTDRRPGYDGREVGFDEAVTGHVGIEAWKLEARPTLVFLYDPGEKKDIRTLLELDSDPTFLALSRFCNLRKVDVGTIARETAKMEYAEGGTLILFCGGKHRYGALFERNLGLRRVHLYVAALIEHEFGVTAVRAVGEVHRILARRAELESELARLEPKLFDPRSGEADPRVEKRLRDARRELTRLRLREEMVTTPLETPACGK